VWRRKGISLCGEGVGGEPRAGHAGHVLVLGQEPRYSALQPAAHPHLGQQLTLSIHHRVHRVLALYAF
jgi:hypothetical protein